MPAGLIDNSPVPRPRAETEDEDDMAAVIEGDTVGATFGESRAAGILVGAGAIGARLVAVRGTLGKQRAGTSLTS
jgi:hypothetical protein